MARQPEADIRIKRLGLPKVLAYGAAGGLAAACLYGTLFCAWLSFVKHAGDDDLDGAVNTDLYHFTMTEATTRRGPATLSDWHARPRNYDWWTVSDENERTASYEYRYWNPLWGTGERIRLTVDKRHSLPWPERSGSSPHPETDGPVIDLRRKGDHSMTWCVSLLPR